MAKDLTDEFENEPDLADAFESEPEFVAPTLAQKVQTGVKDLVAPSEFAMESSANLFNDVADSTLDFARGVGKGLTLNSIDEIGGALSAGAESLYNQFQPETMAVLPNGEKVALNETQPTLDQLYRQNQQAIQNELQVSEERSPVLDIAGQIGGGMTSGSVLGGALGLGKSAEAAKPLLDIAKDQGKIRAGIEFLKRGATGYGKALPVIAAEGALSSKEGNLSTEEGRTKLAEDATGAALFGLPTAFGLQAVTDIAIPGVSKAASAVQTKGREMVDESALLRQMKVAYGYGEQGINPRSTSAQLGTDLGVTNLAELDNTRVKGLMKKIQTADESISKSVGESLEKANVAGTIVNLTPDVRQSITQLQRLADTYPELADNAKVRDVFGKIAASGNGSVTPSEASELIRYTDAFINKFKSATNKTPLETGILSNLMETRKNLSTTLKGAVPEYAKAAERMQSFRTLVPETIIARNRPVDVTSTYYGNLKDKDQKMFDALKSVVQGTTKSGTGAAESRTSFVNLVKGLKQFELDDAARISRGEINSPALEDSASAIEDQIKKYSDDAVARGSMDAISPQTGVGGIAKEAIIGAGAETGRSLALTAANKAGLITNKVGKSATENPVAKLGRGIYNAPNDTVQALASKLKGTVGLEKYGNVLEEAVNSGNNNRKNQALFTIMQNPSARAIVGTEPDEEN